MLLTLTRKNMMTNVIQEVNGTFGGTVRNLVVNTRPSRAMTQNWENVIRFPEPGSSFIISSRKMTLDIQPTRTSTMASCALNSIISA